MAQLVVVKEQILGKQDRSDGLGADDEWRAVSRAGGGGRIRIRTARAALTMLEGRTGADAPSRLKPPDQENPFWPVHFECVLLVGT